jgi:hypothetical protein
MALAVFTAGANAQNSSLRWDETFETYSLGQIPANLPSGTGTVTQGGWDSWDADPNVRGDVVTNPSGPGQVLEIQPNDDTTWNFTTNLLAAPNGYRTDQGTWVFEIDAYYPSTTSGPSWFIIQNDYQHLGPYNWSVQGNMNGSTGLITFDYGANQCVSTALPLNQWFTFHVEYFVDPQSTVLGKGWVRVWVIVGGTKTLLLTCLPGVADPVLGEGYNVVDGVFGGVTNNGMLQFENLDLYGDPTQVGPVYYDNAKCWEKPDRLHIDTGATTLGGLPYIDAATGGTATIYLNASYQDEGDIVAVVASAAGSSPGFPLPGPAGVTLLPANPDALFVAMLNNPNAPIWATNIDVLGDYGAKPSGMQFMFPQFPALIGSGFTVAFGATVFDTGGTNPTFTFRWASGGLVQWD